MSKELLDRAYELIVQKSYDEAREILEELRDRSSTARNWLAHIDMLSPRPEPEPVIEAEDESDFMMDLNEDEGGTDDEFDFVSEVDEGEAEDEFDFISDLDGEAEEGEFDFVAEVDEGEAEDEFDFVSDLDEGEAEDEFDFVSDLDEGEAEDEFDFISEIEEDEPESEPESEVDIEAITPVDESERESSLPLVTPIVADDADRVNLLPIEESRASAPAPDAPAAVMSGRWEYREIVLRDWHQHISNIEYALEQGGEKITIEDAYTRLLNENGAQGWEVVSEEVLPQQYVRLLLKRMVRD